MLSVWMALLCLVFLLPSAHAHGISESTRESMTEGGLLDYVRLGAEHMVTGYDHLLFLFGVLFFLTGFRDVVRFITAFTLGHCITLLGATLAGISANAYLIDAVIALSVIYKGFENLDGFKKFFGVQAPNLLWMVFVFGLIHGFGLSTRLQELSLGDEGMVGRILAFNVGVELGQIAALMGMLAFFAAWRSSTAFARFDKVANSALVVAGVGLFVYQIHGYTHDHSDAHHGEHIEEHGEDNAHYNAPAEEVEPTPPAPELPGPAVDDAVAPELAPEPELAPDPEPTEHGHTHPKPHRHGSGAAHTH